VGAQAGRLAAAQSSCGSCDAYQKNAVGFTEFSEGSVKLPGANDIKVNKNMSYKTSETTTTTYDHGTETTKTTDSASIGVSFILGVEFKATFKK